MVKNSFLIFTLLLFFISNAGGDTVSNNKDSEELTKESGLTRIYEIYGMDCPGCHGGLEKLVKKIEAVQTAEANWKEKRLTVTLKPGAQLDDEEVFDAIKRANFTVGKRIK